MMNLVDFIGRNKCPLKQDFTAFSFILTFFMNIFGHHAESLTVLRKFTK